jgi:CBS domain-containing protein
MHRHIREAPLLRTTDTVADAIRTVLATDLPALPVTTPDGRYAGVWGEREFLTAIFPKYLGTLGYAGFLPDDLDEALEERLGALDEPVGDHVNAEHVDLDSHAAEASIAEIFLHHRVLIVPIVEDGRVVGVVRRADFFRALARRALERHG